MPRVEKILVSLIFSSFIPFIEFVLTSPQNAKKKEDTKNKRVGPAQYIRSSKT